MNYKIVRDMLGEVVAFGPNTEGYEPAIKNGWVLSIEEVLPKPSLGATKAAFILQIDSAVLAIYDRPMSLSKEYEAREKAAADYKAAGYTGAVPARLAGFATPAGMTATAAADLILSQAAQMRGVLDSLGDLRMRKYEVQRATTEADARTAHTAIMAKIAAISAAL